MTTETGQVFLSIVSDCLGAVDEKRYDYLRHSKKEFSDTEYWEKRANAMLLARLFLLKLYALEGIANYSIENVIARAESEYPAVLEKTRKREEDSEKKDSEKES